MWVCGGAFHWLSFPLSLFVVPANALTSRLLTPVAIRAPGEDDEPDLYLNINVSHELVSHISMCMSEVNSLVDGFLRFLNLLMSHVFLFFSSYMQVGGCSTKDVSNWGEKNSLCCATRLLVVCPEYNYVYSPVWNPPNIID
mmetsp:Transcript_26316/g.72312  ORF Transcript_26316/g.72312 Transcript_26316/m.72312 type:complete len:141 (-) Transcript_26316:1236-1658(-)